LTLNLIENRENVISFRLGEYLIPVFPLTLTSMDWGDLLLLKEGAISVIP
jgi:hypothetical protein